MTLIPDFHIETVLLADATRAASTNSLVQTTHGPARGLVLYLDVSASTNAQTIQVLIQIQDHVTSAFHTILDGGAVDYLGSTGNRTYIAYPGIAAAAEDVDQIVGFPIPRRWRVRVVHSAGGDFDYSISNSYLY